MVKGYLTSSWGTVSDYGHHLKYGMQRGMVASIAEYAGIKY